MDQPTDVLILGSGIAGLSCALMAAQSGTVRIATKKEPVATNTNRAQGGIAAVFGSGDSAMQHATDTLLAGADLCHPEAVSIMIEEGPAIVRQLVDWGVEFTRSEAGNFHLGREGGHSHHRIVHASDLTGAEIERALLRQVQEHPNIEICEHHVAVDLITEHHFPDRRSRTGRITCLGAYVLETHSGEVRTMASKVTVLATGGAGQIWLHTTNPEIATGDGVAMAYRAGARVGNLEFMQFHPTTLYHPSAGSFLISEAVRGHGAELIASDGARFMDEYHDSGSLAPRDIVARAIDREMKRRGDDCVYLDITHNDSDDTRHHFPNIHQKCLEYGIDITSQPIPVVPAAHYMCGGVVTDLEGRTDIRNLFAAGEVTLSGVHGANRLASNSLLEAVVFAKRASRAAIESLSGIHSASADIPPWNLDDTINAEEWVLLSHDSDETRRLMWDYVGIVRSDVRLRRASMRLELLWKEVEEFYRRTRISPELLELRNMVAVATLVVMDLKAVAMAPEP